MSRITPAAAPGAGWRLRLLGALHARCGDTVIEHFPSRAVATLAARLGMFPDRVHGREELAELLWPDADPTRAANRLRNALSTLKRLLATPALSGHAVIAADRRGVRANPSLLDSDVAEFERHLAARDDEAARACCRGELLPGFYDEWVLDERRRIEALAERMRERLDQARHLARSPARQPSSHEPPHDLSSPARRVWRAVPQLPDSFLGRERELAQLAQAVETSRVVTLLGPAGAGKSRLAMEFAGTTEAFDLVAWVPLLSCAGPGPALEQVRAALGLGPGAVLPLDQIAARLEGERALLVLDNLEHLIEDGRARFVDALLGRAAGLRLLITTQQRLVAPRARTLTLAPLALPPPRAHRLAIERSAAVRLFVDRARQRRADFTLHEGNAEAIAAVCERVQGLPLVRQLALAELGRTLAAAAGRAVVPTQTHHASMDSALAWSWQLLTPQQGEDLALLAELRGEFGASAAAALLGLDSARRVPPGRASGVLRTPRRVQALVALSWLQARSQQGEPGTFAMLAVMRQFVRRHAGAALDALARARHRGHFARRAAEHGAVGRPLPAAELPDHLHAIETALADGDAEPAALHALALRAHFVSQGTPDAALALLRALAGAPALTADRRIEMASLLAPLLLDAGRAAEGLQLAQATRTTASGLGPRSWLEAEIAWIQVVWRSRRDGAVVLDAAQAALQAARALGDAALVGRAALPLGGIVWAHLQDNAAALALFKEAEAAFLRCGDARAAAATLPGRVACLLGQGELREALALGEAGRAAAARHADVQTEVLLLNRIGEITARLRRHAAAVRAGRRQVALSAAHGLAYHLAYGLWNLALPLARLGRGAEAARVLGFAHRYWSERFGGLGEDDARYVARVRAAVARRGGAAGWDAGWGEGQALDARDAVALALDGEAFAEAVESAEPTATRAAH
jgi:hypothetical protein